MAGLDAKMVGTIALGIAGSGSGLHCAAKQTERAEAALAYGAAAEIGANAYMLERDSLAEANAVLTLRLRRCEARRLPVAGRGVATESGEALGPPAPRHGLTQGATAVPRVVVGWIKSLFTVPARDRRG